MIEKYLDKLEYSLIIKKLVDDCLTYNGKALALNLHPSNQKINVKHSLSETSDAIAIINICGNFPIYKVNDQSINIKKIKSNTPLTAKSLLEIANVLKISSELKKYYKDSEVELSNISVYFNDLYTNPKIEKKIFDCIISENEIADNASKSLYSIRKNKRSLESSIRNKLNSIIHSNSFSKYLMDDVITMRNDRFVVPVKEEYKSKVKGFVHDTSGTGSTLYIEPLSVFDMNNSINDLIVEEKKEIENILKNLSIPLFSIYSELSNTINLIGKLDFISSKARYAIKNDCTCPEIGEFIDLKNARHPLIEPDKVVPISLNIGTENFKTLVITGPNTGGKTVTLKTVGLLCAMAQSGLHIPVSDNSTIKIFDNIFADIGDDQSIQESLSTFSSHIKNIVNILNTYTKDSLVLVDELGAGTDPVEGASLAISLLENFYQTGAFTIATTHYSEIKNYCITHDGFENASVEFNIDTLKPTYNLLLGIPGKSNAFAISEQIGIPKKIINRAFELISEPDTNIENLMKQIYDNKIKIDEEEKELSKNLNQIELLRKSLQNDLSDKLLQEEKKIKKSKAEARQILIDAKEEASRIIKQLNKLDSSDINEAHRLRNQLNDSAKKIDGNGIDLTPLLNLNNKNSTSIDSDVYKKKKNTKSFSSNISNSIRNISNEINLIGENVASAVEELDKYLDNCKLAHIHQVRVVHGKGSGKLREGIHKYLKKSKYVESFRIGEYGEGDYGVTIVYLKS